MKIIEIKDNTVKSNICKKVLCDLPEWFGIEESTKEYIDSVKKYTFVCAYEGEEAVGFYSLRKENDDVLDMYVLGVLKKYHGNGIGTKLQMFANEYAKSNNFKFLMVLTLAEEVGNKEYLLTRRFYLKQGFVDFYQNDNIFDKYNPCQIMMKKI